MEIHSPYDHDFRLLRADETEGFHQDVRQVFRCRNCRLVYADADGYKTDEKVNKEMRYTVCGRSRIPDDADQPY